MILRKDDPIVFAFESKAVKPDAFAVMAFSGTEEISRPYSFEIDLVSDDPDIDLHKMLYAGAVLRIEKGDAVRKIHGVVAECRLLDALTDHQFHYQVVLKPRVWSLSLSRQNQIYQQLSVPEIIAQEIKASTAKNATKHAKAGLFEDDFELRLTRKYSPREYTVQYRESDFDFIARLMEHEGIFYFFEQGADREKMIITDDNLHFAAIAGGDTLSYRPASGLARAADEAILSFTCASRRIPSKVVLKDYNYRLPHVTLQADAEVDNQAHGLISDYADHFKTPEEGIALARIRAQELASAKQTFAGRSDSIRLVPGYRFKLEEYFRPAFNSEYIVTGMTHSGRQPLEGVAGLKSSANEQASYGNTLACILGSVAYRPPRRTPKPVIVGLMNAHVDAALLEDRAEIDEQGRYKLVMPFDLSGTAAGASSRYVRKAQPYGGRDMGMHFPLHKGTEVICSFINGDPDRPIITGVVPNPMTASVVSSANHTKNVIKTASGAFLEFNDGRGKPPANTLQGGGQLGAQQQMQSVDGRAGHSTLPLSGRHAQTIGAWVALDGNKASVPGYLELQQQLAGNDTYKESDGTGSNDKWFRIKVPNYDANNDSYLRLGAGVAEEVIEQKGKGDDAIVMTYDVTPVQGDALAPIRRDMAINCIEGNRIVLDPAGVPGSAPPVFTLSDNAGNATLGAQGQLQVYAPSISTPQDTVIIAAIHTRYSNCVISTKVTLNISKAGDLYPGGWFDFTSGDRTSITIGNKEEKVMSEEGWCAYEGVHKVTGDVARKVTLEHTSAFSGAFGDDESYFAGTKTEGFLGFKNAVSLGSSFEAYAGFKYETHLDWNFQIGTQGTVKLINGNEYTQVDEQQTFGTEIKLHVVEKDMTPTTPWAVIHVIAQLLGTGVVTGLAGAKSGLHDMDTKGTHIAGDVMEWSTHGAFALTHAVMLVWSYFQRKKIVQMHAEALAVTQLNLTKYGIELINGETGIIIADKKIHLVADEITFNNIKINSKGLTLPDGNIEVKAGNIAVSGDIESKRGRLKDPQHAGSPVPAPPAPRAPARIKSIADRKKELVKSGLKI